LPEQSSGSAVSSWGVFLGAPSTEKRTLGLPTSRNLIMKQYLPTDLSGVSNREGGDGILQGNR
jgi:hypothetical protein